MEYNIEYVFIEGSAFHSIFCTLTGLSEKEVQPYLKNRMGGQMFVKSFQKLGFNTNHRFCKFDPETIYPVILRCSEFNKKGSWYALIYHQGKVWNPYNNEILSLVTVKGKHFILEYSLKVTSMLQVWI